MPAAVALPYITAAVAAAGTAYSIYSGEKQQSAQKKANKQAQANAAKQAQQAEQEINRANQKSPDVGALLSANQQQSLSGQSGTMLTGSQGIDPNSLTLGKSTLLGG